MRTIILLLILCSSASAAVIYGNALDVTGQPVPNQRVIFKPLSTPLSSADGVSTYLDYTKPTNVWPGGWFTNTLVGGFYAVQFTGSKTITIMVPTNNTSYTFDYVAQLATNAPVFSYPLIWGLISGVVRPGTGITFTTNNAGFIGESITINSVSFGPVEANTFAMTNGARRIMSVYAYPTNVFALSYYSLDGTVATLRYGGFTNGESFIVRSGNTSDTNILSYSITIPR